MYDLYRRLRLLLPPAAANAVCAAWYAMLALLILYLAFEPTAEFNYLNI